MCPDARGWARRAVSAPLAVPGAVGAERSWAAFTGGKSWVKHNRHTCDFLVVSPSVEAEINNLLPGGTCGHYRIKQRGDTGSFCHLRHHCHLAGSVMISSHLFLNVLRPVCASVCVLFPFLFLHPLAPGEGRSSCGALVPEFQLLPSSCGFCAGRSDRVSNSGASGDRH